MNNIKTKFSLHPDESDWEDWDLPPTQIPAVGTRQRGPSAKVERSWGRGSGTEGSPRPVLLGLRERLESCSQLLRFEAQTHNKNQTEACLLKERRSR